MVSIDSPETSVTGYQQAIRNILECLILSHLKYRPLSSLSNISLNPTHKASYFMLRFLVCSVCLLNKPVSYAGFK